MSPEGYTSGSIGPLVEVLEPGLLEISADVLSDTLLDEHFRAYGQFCRENTRPVAVLVTAGPFASCSATQRQRIADFEKETRAHDARYVAGCALLAPNALIRGLMTAVFWLQPPVYPYRFVSSREEGLSWLRSRGKEAE